MYTDLPDDQYIDNEKNERELEISMETVAQTIAINYDGNDDNNNTIDVSKKNYPSYSALLSFCDPLRYLKHNETLMLIDGSIRINVAPLFDLSDKIIPIDVNSEIHQHCCFVLNHLVYWFMHCSQVC